jgi:FSR family fosmidomycin resistance protein-like MFS transporter
MGVFITVGTLGFSLGPLFSVGVVGLVGLEGTWLAMLPGVALGLVLMAALARLPLPAHERRRGAPLRELRPVLRPLALLYFAVVARSAVAFGFMTFLPMLLHSKGYAVSVGGWVLAAYLALGALGGFLGGWLAERFGGQRVVVHSFVGSIPLFAAFLVLPTVPGLVCLVLGNFVLQGSLPVNVVLGQELSPRHSSTVSSLLMGAAWGVGGLIVSPIGALADAFGLSVGLTVLSSLLVGGLLCAMALPSPHEHTRLAEIAHPATAEE